jgi:hypothetical protein
MLLLFRYTRISMRKLAILFFLTCSLAQLTSAQLTARDRSGLRADVEFLASDEMMGRGSGSYYEGVAARYLASEMLGLGLVPGGDTKPDGQRDYLQRVEFDYDKLDKRILRATGAEGRTGKGRTQNVIGILKGKTDEVIILSAHYDHIGSRPPVEGKDTIFNGADDDASGTAAVMELARALSRGAKLRRTVYFVLFGAEEFGGVGSDYFDEHPPVPLEKVVANLEFEMLGRPDPKVAPGTLWLTGFDKSDLGKVLEKHGAALVADPHPEQNFFQRSDNYQLALKGVVAHTVSSFGLHAQYHHPDDDVAHIDWQHLERSVESMVSPVKWLADSDFKPTWVPGQKPEPKRPN